jgi:hypothetical protein
MSLWRYSIFFQVCLVGSNGRCAMPMARPAVAVRWGTTRTAADLPVGLVTATVSCALVGRLVHVGADSRAVSVARRRRGYGSSLASRRAPAPLQESNRANWFLGDESLEHPDEATSRVELRQVADPFEDLEPAARDSLVRFPPWWTGRADRGRPR